MSTFHGYWIGPQMKFTSSWPERRPMRHFLYRPSNFDTILAKKSLFSDIQNRTRSSNEECKFHNLRIQWRRKLANKDRIQNIQMSTVWKCSLVTVRSFHSSKLRPSTFEARKYMQDKVSTIKVSIIRRMHAILVNAVAGMIAAVTVLAFPATGLAISGIYGSPTSVSVERIVAEQLSQRIRQLSDEELVNLIQDLLIAAKASPAVNSQCIPEPAPEQPGPSLEPDPVIQTQAPLLPPMDSASTSRSTDSPSPTTTITETAIPEPVIIQGPMLPPFFGTVVEEPPASTSADTSSAEVIDQTARLWRTWMQGSGGQLAVPLVPPPGPIPDSPDNWLWKLLKSRMALLLPFLLLGVAAAVAAARQGSKRTKKVASDAKQKKEAESPSGPVFPFPWRGTKSELPVIEKLQPLKSMTAAESNSAERPRMDTGPNGSMLLGEKAKNVLWTRQSIDPVGDVGPLVDRSKGRRYGGKQISSMPGLRLGSSTTKQEAKVMELRSDSTRVLEPPDLGNGSKVVLSKSVIQTERINEPETAIPTESKVRVTVDLDPWHPNGLSKSHHYAPGFIPVELKSAVGVSDAKTMSSSISNDDEPKIQKRVEGAGGRLKPRIDWFQHDGSIWTRGTHGIYSQVGTSKSDD